MGLQVELNLPERGTYDGISKPSIINSKNCAEEKDPTSKSKVVVIVKSFSLGCVLTRKNEQNPLNLERVFVIFSKVIDLTYLGNRSILYN